MRITQRKLGRKRLLSEEKIASSHVRIYEELIAQARALATPYRSYGVVINDALRRGLREMRGGTGLR